MKGIDWKEKLNTLFRLRFLLPVSIDGVIAAVLVRLVQLHVAIDFTTGFFSEKTVWVPLLTVLLVLFALYVAGQAICSRLPAVSPYEGLSLRPIGVVAMALGGVMILSGFAAILQSAGSGGQMLSYIVILLGIAAGGAFLYQGYLLFQHQIRKLQGHILMLVPAVWSVARLMMNFIAHTTIASISQYLFDILFDAALVLFLFYFARFTAGLRQKRQERFLLLFGLLTVMLGAVSTVPPLFCKLFEGRGIGQYISLPDFTALFLTVFTGWMMLLFVSSWLNAAHIPPEKPQFADMGCEYRYETVGIDGIFRYWQS